ncbi:MAG: Dna2/Cas4 domain-containing protein [Candidatus Thermoplasmatota archaeon]|nr:Dna2/Cas4 domain-containing protein [Candidatus Thermoplasmatota archaeon]MCL5786352.1 Dna2/Cas4 domain-containing protein [Candidatus Thermoplasmatota archaeon]
MVAATLAFFLFLFLIFLLIILVLVKSRSGITAVPPGRIVYGDLQSKGTVLRSNNYGLSGKPDMVIRTGNFIIPYEYKSSRATNPRDGHLLQMAAYFLILEEVYPNLKIPYGVLKYEGSAFRVRNSLKLRTDLLYTMREMRSTYSMPDRAHSNPRRCISCSFRQSCPQSLINNDGWQEPRYEYVQQ